MQSWAFSFHPIKRKPQLSGDAGLQEEGAFSEQRLFNIKSTSLSRVPLVLPEAFQMRWVTLLENLKVQRLQVRPTRIGQQQALGIREKSGCDTERRQTLRAGDIDPGRSSTCHVNLRGVNCMGWKSSKSSSLSRAFSSADLLRRSGGTHPTLGCLEEGWDPDSGA